jgi:hypothetical protein
MNSAYGLAEVSFAELDLKHAAFYCMLFRLRHVMTYWDSVDVVIGWPDLDSPIRNKLIPSYRDIAYYKDERWMNCKEWMNDYMVDLARIGFTAQLSSTGLDGVDLLAHIAKHDKDRYHVILSRDKRVLQCLSDNTAVQIDLRTEREGTPQVVTKKDFITQFELQPEQWPILLGYVGNRSDNLFGIKGVGHTGILKYLNGVDVSPKLKNLVEASWADAQVQIKVNTLPIAEFELESPPMNHYDSREAIQVLKEHKLDFDTTNKFWSNIGEGHV